MWLFESILYQIYPIGFCGAQHENNGDTAHGILKVKDWVAHFKSLNVSGVLFNPIFDSDTHGYDTRDYSKIDVRLGTNEDFKDVCKTLKENGIKIVLDGVFNHVGRGFWAFEDVRKNRENSPYRDWFHISFEGNSNYNDGFWYEGWEGHFELVKLNLKNPAVTEHIFNCVRNWIDEFDIDGLRLDVAYSLDHDFMRNLHNVCLDKKQDFALIGEVLFGDYNIIVNDSMLHSCTNYECYKGIFSAINSNNMFEIAHSLQRQFGSEQWCIYRGKQLMSFVDNHDVSRISSILSDKNNVHIAYALLMGMPGVPCIYYGSEWGEDGAKGGSDDWHLRPCFDSPKPNELTHALAQMITARKSSKALCKGDYTNIVIESNRLLFKRQFDGETVFVAVNITGENATLHSGELCGNFVNIVSGESVNLNGSLEIGGYGYCYLRRC